MKRSILVGCLTWLLVQPLAAQAAGSTDLQLVGQGKMRWLFFDLYEAQFYSADGRYQEARYPQALTLRYLRDIKQQDLIKATISEWQRLNIAWSPAWQQQLAQLWPSVKTGDALSVKVDSNGRSYFYLNEQPLGEIADAAFGPAFLAIWLSDNSQNPTLTRQLKGY